MWDILHQQLIRSIENSVNMEDTDVMDAARSTTQNLKGKMKYQVELRMFKNGKIRTVNVPDAKLKGRQKVDNILDLILYHGQNDFQPQQLPSVSMGDVIRYQGKRYLILSRGFRKLKPGEFTSAAPTLEDILPGAKRKQQKPEGQNEPTTTTNTPAVTDTPTDTPA